MKKGEIYEGVIEKVDFPNKGYVFVEDQKVLIKNGIPGQKVRFMIKKKRSGRVFTEARSNSDTAIRWSFLLEMRSKTDHCPLACIRREVRMIS